MGAAKAKKKLEEHPAIPESEEGICVFHGTPSSERISEIGVLIDHFVRDVKNNDPRRFSRNLAKGLGTLLKTSGLEKQDLRRVLWERISLGMNEIPYESRHILSSSIVL